MSEEAERTLCLSIDGTCPSLELGGSNEDDVDCGARGSRPNRYRCPLRLTPRRRLTPHHLLGHRLLRCNTHSLSWLSDVVGGESVHLVSFEGLIGSHLSLLEYTQAHFLRLGGSPTLPPWLNYTASHANPSADATVYATAVYLRNEVSRRGCRSRTGKPRGHDQALRALAASLSHPDTVKCWSLRPLERLLRERDVSDLFPRFGTPDLFDLGLPLLNASTKRVCVVDNPTAADRCHLAAYLRNASHRVHASCLQEVVDEAGCGPDEAS